MFVPRYLRTLSAASGGSAGCGSAAGPQSSRRVGTRSRKSAGQSNQLPVRGGPEAGAAEEAIAETPQLKRPIARTATTKMKPPINAMDSRSRSGGLWMSGLTVIGGKTTRLKEWFTHFP